MKKNLCLFAAIFMLSAGTLLGDVSIPYGEGAGKVDFTNFTTTNLDSMSSLFKGCINLKKFVYGDKFNTEKLNHMDELFALCESLEEIDLIN